MSFYINRIPKLFNLIHPGSVSRITTDEKVLYLSFDDGPTPEYTEKVLTLLKENQAKATFFFLGRNVEANPEIFKSVKSGGHTIGNHSYSHLMGWNTNNKIYVEDVKRCDEIFDSKLFRPPYGKMKPSQFRAIKQFKKVILWDVLTGDYDPDKDIEQCWRTVLKFTKPGSIIVLHDSVKAGDRCLELTKKILKRYKKMGFKFESL